MAETVLASLKQLQEIAAKNKEISDNLTGRLETIEKVGPQANVLEGVKVNGKALAIVQKMVDILVTTGAADGTIQVNGVDVSVKGLAQMAYKAQVSQGDLDQALIAILNEKAVKSTTLSGYGIGDAYTKEEVNAKISAVYKPAGCKPPGTGRKHPRQCLQCDGRFHDQHELRGGRRQQLPEGHQCCLHQNGEHLQVGRAGGLCGYFRQGGQGDRQRPEHPRFHEYLQDQAGRHRRGRE